MTKKRFMVILSALLLIVIVSVFLIKHFENSPESFENLLGTNKANITKVLMRDGSNGNYVITDDKEKINEIINLINDRDYTKSANQEDRTGYRYYYDFYSGDNIKMRITGDGDVVEINNTYYGVSNPISSNSLTTWFNSLPIQK